MTFLCSSLTVGMVALAGGLTACQNPLGRACTLIGCSDGLIVQLEGTLPSHYTVTVNMPGSADPTVVECSTESPCGDMLHFRDFTPDAVRVAVESDSASKSEEFQVQYEMVRPNGADCPPECRQGTVVFQW